MEQEITPEHAHVTDRNGRDCREKGQAWTTPEPSSLREAEPSGRREGNNGRASGRTYRNRPPSGSNIRDQYQRFSVAMLAQAVCLAVLRHLAGPASLGSPATLGAASCSLPSGGALHCLETLRMNVTAKRRCTALLPTVVSGQAGNDLATPRTADITMIHRLKKRCQRGRKSIVLQMTEPMTERPAGGQ